MKICLIGGIYGSAGAQSGYLRVTPETTLESGLREAGHQVTTLGHYSSVDFGHFDVVHVHHLSYGAARLAADPSWSPLVFTPHDASLLSGTPLSPERALAMKYVLSRADRIVSLSQVEAEFQKRVQGISPDRVVTIPNGIDARLFPFVRSNTAGRGRPWQLLFVGQLIPLKGCDLILRALAGLRQDVEISLVYQTADLVVELEALASSLGIQDKVRFLGRLEPTRLAVLYQQSDLLVAASETEALPSVITEAMYSGLPFVSTAVGGIREQAAGFGHLLARRTVADLVEGISLVLNNYDEYSNAGERMSQQARGAYSIQSMVDRHIAAYQCVAGRRPLRHKWRYLPANRLVRAAVTRWRTHPARPPGTGVDMGKARPAAERQ
jgi:glycosyltransferase involved in cell wall biosynthesis